MDTDIRRIGVGNNKFPSVTENDIITPKEIWTFDSETITFDSMIHTFDEE